MLKNIVSFAIVLCLFVGCANPFENFENMVECKKNADKMSGCIEKVPYKNYKNDVFRIETTYKNGVKNGFEKWYRWNQQLEKYILITETPYKDGKIHGVKKDYYDSGAIQTEYSYKNDEREWLKVYYDNGVLYSKTLYKNDKKHGVERIHYKSGQLKEEIPYKEGGITGILKRYHENGVLYYEAPYKNDLMQGGEKYYDEFGNLEE